jgi:N-acetylneuraminic acid mutarotase
MEAQPMRFCARFFGTLLAISMSLLGPASLAAKGTWNKVAELPVPLMGLHANTLNQKIYIVGGQRIPSELPSSGATGSSDVSSKLHIFDPESRRWSLGADIPTARGFLGTAVVGGQLYAIGGSPHMIQHDPGLGIVEVYDPETDRWSSAPEMPTPRADLTASVVDGTIYAIGGTRHVAVDALGTVEMYDPASKIWVRKADMPTPRLHLTSAVVDGKIYVFGGGPEWPVPLAALEIYDPVTDSWTRGADMPTPRTGVWCSVMNGKIYVVGGLSWENKALSTVEVYDPTTDKWEAAPNMPTPRFLMAVETLRNRLYVLGGSATDYTSQSAVEEFVER